MPLEGVPECRSGARSRKGKRHHWFGGRSRPPGAYSAKATAPPSYVQVPSERFAFKCSPQLHAAQVGRAWRCLLKACSGARSRKGKRHHWYGCRSGPPGACSVHATAPPRATCKFRASVVLQLLVAACLGACRSVALALDHERASDTTGVAAVVDHLERAPPTLPCHRAPCKRRANLFASVARQCSARA
jgi:hypothetical protein